MPDFKCRSIAVASVRLTGRALRRLLSGRRSPRFTPSKIETATWLSRRGRNRFSCFLTIPEFLLVVFLRFTTLNVGATLTAKYAINRQPDKPAPRCFTRTGPAHIRDWQLRTTAFSPKSVATVYNLAHPEVSRPKAEMCQEIASLASRLPRKPWRDGGQQSSRCR